MFSYILISAMILLQMALAQVVAPQFPRVLEPSDKTYWQVGKPQVIKWDLPKGGKPVEMVDIDLFVGTAGDAVRVSQLGTSVPAKDKEITFDTKDLKPYDNYAYFVRLTSYDEDDKSLGTSDSQAFVISMTAPTNSSSSSGHSVQAGMGFMAAILPALLL